MKVLFKQSFLFFTMLRFWNFARLSKSTLMFILIFKPISDYSTILANKCVCSNRNWCNNINYISVGYFAFAQSMVYTYQWIGVFEQQNRWRLTYFTTLVCIHTFVTGGCSSNKCIKVPKCAYLIDIFTFY